MFTIVKTSSGDEGFTADKNGNFPVLLTNLGGKMPVVMNSKGEQSKIHLLNGTVAKREGIEVNKTYLVQFESQGVQTYEKNGVTTSSNQFTPRLIQEIKGVMDLINGSKGVGAATNFVVAETTVDEDGVDIFKEVDEVVGEVEGVN